MKRSDFELPDTYQAGSRYFLMDSRNGHHQRFAEVTFIAYRPHPGEVVVDGGLGPRVVHRSYLYKKINPTPGGQGRV